MHLAEHFTVVHSFSVQILIGNSSIGEGKVVERTPCVHGKILKDTELKLQIMNLKYDGIDHPDYDYKLEKGGFLAWLADDCMKKKWKKKEKGTVFLSNFYYILYFLVLLSTIYLRLLTFSSTTELYIFTFTVSLFPLSTTENCYIEWNRMGK